MNPASASLPVTAIRRSRPIVSRISVALRLGPLIVPQDRGTQDVVVAIERDQPVHLSGEPHRLDVVAGEPGGRHHLPDRPATAPSHQRRGSCSLHSGSGVSNVYSGQDAT